MYILYSLLKKVFSLQVKPIKVSGIHMNVSI